MTKNSNKKRLLVLVTDYPNNCGGVALMYIHTRNLEYASVGHEVVVLNFNANEPYIYEGIKVITLKQFEEENVEYDILILHAVNLRNHYRFLRKYECRFPKMIFFFHGHEVLKINEAYSKPYSYMKSNKLKDLFQDLYDELKLIVWRIYLPKVKYKSEFVFVSHWMEEHFYKYTKIKPSMLDGHTHITYNSVGQIFEKETYDGRCEKKYDFITIRSFLDGSKYCIDLVNEWAKNTPEAKFLVIGKGEFFHHYSKASNIVWMNQTLNHKEMLNYLDASKYALMPTRTDAQGLMMCEMAAYGIPVITSDIPVCHEVFDGFENIFYLSNENGNVLSEFLKYNTMSKKDSRYYLSNTVNKELELIEK